MDTRAIAEMTGTGAAMLLAAGTGGDWLTSMLLLGVAGAAVVMTATRLLWKQR